MVTKTIKFADLPPERAEITPTYGSRSALESVPRYQIPERSMTPDEAYNLIHDELMLDGNAKLNLATFVTTWMEPQAEKLMAETFNKNMIDKDEYPATAMIEDRCVNMVARLFNAPAAGEAVGCSAIGSSEAVMLAGMAFKWKWRARRTAAGKPADKPNMVMGINVQVVWEKFCRYWEVEPRYVPMEGSRTCISAEEAMKLVDENTICVVGILGSTFTGEYEPIGDLNAALLDFKARSGIEVPLHVDAASGGFVAPFLDPDLEWDFRLPTVQSINVSGHKYGLVYPGVGWVIWRDKDQLPDDLVFHVNYLGGDMPTFTLNFSRPGNQIVGQYYNFLRLGREGYTRIMVASRDIALYLSDRIAKLGPFELLSRGDTIPVFAFKLKDPSHYTVFDISEKLRERGWQVPAYTFPANREDLAALRVVIREGFSRDLADMLLDDLTRAVEHFETRPARPPAPAPSARARAQKC
jgi:glutamate decarboxylase